VPNEGVPGAAAGHPPCITERFTFKADRTGETTVVTLAGELDMAATFRIEPELERLTRGTGIRTLVLRMHGVEFMDSTALGLLLATQQRLRSEGIRFVLADPSDSVRRMLELTGAGEALVVTPWPSRP
jgi:anti-sigma B factor antagonist